jgi:hypothetical protein
MNVAITVYVAKVYVNAILVTLMLIVVYNTALKTVMDMEVALITHVAYVNLVLKVLVVKQNNAQ